MIFNPEHNDIVINFYRAKVYRFDKNNRRHYIDSSRCRYATFEERERFLKLDTETAHINDVLDMTVRNRSKWDKKAVPPITIEISDRLLSKIIKFANKLNVYDYETIIDELFKISEQCTKNEPADNTDIKALKRKCEKQTKILQIFKKELEKIEL